MSNKGGAGSPLPANHSHVNGAHGVTRPTAGFTMVEIAISLAVIGIALVAIIGVLPIGLRMQRANREQTVINQDATVFIEAIRGGARGADDLTNYVFAITNYWTEYNAGGGVQAGGNGINNGYTFTSASVAAGYFPQPSPSGYPINSGARIIGLLSTPEYTDLAGSPTNNLFSGGYSNHVVAYVRSLSGPAVEKPPQANDSIVREDSFSYRVLCVNSPVAVDTNIFNLPFTDPRRIYNDQLTANLHELRLLFEWPQLPSGGLGPGRQTFRTMVAGRFAQTNDNNQMLYFYQSQTFANAP